MPRFLMITILFLETRLDIGGSEKVWLELIKGLDTSRFRTLLCCLYEAGSLGEQLKKSGIPVYSGLMRNRFDLQGTPRLMRLLQKERVDILYLINQPLVQFVGSLCGRMAGIPALVCSVHSTGEIDRVRRRFWAYRLTFPWMDRIIVLSESHKDYLMEQGANPAKIEVIPNGIKWSQFTSTAKTNELRRSLGINERDPVVGIVAMLRKEKSHETFLKAAAQVSKEIPDVHFLIVGEGPERAYLEAVTKKLGLMAKVHFLGVREDIPEIMSLLNVGVLCSKPVVETLSLAALEYMAAGKPVVASRVGSLPELIEEGQTGFLVQSGDAEALANSIVLLLKDPVLAQKMGENGREKVAHFYSAAAMIQKTEALFAALTETRKRS